MSENAEALLAIWDGKSRGTRSMIELARKRGLRTAVLRTDEDRMEYFDASGPLADIWENAEERAGMIQYSGNRPRPEAEQSAGKMALEYAAELSTKDGPA